MPRVPVADDTKNRFESEVVGNKSDAAVSIVSTVASIVAYLKGLFGAIAPRVATGTTDIDDSVQDESAAWFALLTIAPATGSPIHDARVVLDLAKATTGFAAVESTASIQFRVARKVDGTNWRGDTRSETAAITGTNAAGHSTELAVGDIGVTEQARIEAKMSADATLDMEIPYNVLYKSAAAATITPVAAG